MSRKSRAKHIKQNPNPETKKTGGDEKSTNRHVYVEPGVQIDFVKDLKDQHQTSQTEDRAQQKKQLFWTRVATALILLYTAFAGWQTVLTNVAIKDGRNNFIKDQRPYVWIANPANGRANVDYEPRPLNGMVVTVHYTNFGKSPAVGLRWASEFDVGDFVIPTPMSTKKTILPPNKDDFLIFPSQPLTPEQIVNLRSTQHAIVFKIWWKYFDTSGNWYETDTCMWNITPVAWGPCETGNDIKDCQKEACQQ